jgi:hypothetical protein
MNSLIDTGNQGLTVTEHGLQIKRQLSAEEWKDLLTQARRAKTSYLSILSDITAYGRRTFGDDFVNDALEQLEFELSDATKAEAIALVPLASRALYDLSSEHAYILGTLLHDDAERMKWAAACQEHSLTAFELKKSIEKGAVTRQAEITERSGHSDGIPSIQAVQFQFQKWRRQFPDAAAIRKLPVKEREKILQNITPIVELAAELEKSLSH